MRIQQLLVILMVMAGWMSVARAAATPSGVTLLTAAELQHFVSEALIEAGAGERMQVNLLGAYPEVLFQHDSAFAPDIHFTELDRQGRTFTADAVLKTVSSAATLGKAFTIRGRYAELVEVPVLTSRLTKSDVISEADIEYHTISEFKIRDNTVLDASEMVGLSPKRLIAPNRAVRKSELVQPLVISKGDTVTMYFKTSHMELKTIGEAMRDATQGQIIGVRNVDSFQTVKGEVIGPGLVRVPPSYGQAIN